MNDDKLEHKDTLYISITHIFNFSALFIWIYRESYMGDQRRKDKLGKKNKENRTTKDQEEQVLDDPVRSKVVHPVATQVDQRSNT